MFVVYCLFLYTRSE